MKESKLFAVFIAALVGLAGLLFVDTPDAGRIYRQYTPTASASIALADSVYASATEVFRVDCTPDIYSQAGFQEPDQLLDGLMLRVNIAGASGGTNVVITAHPAWTATDSSATDALAFARSGNATAVNLTSTAATAEYFVQVFWDVATVTAQSTTGAILPPYVAIKVAESRTAGTLTIDVLEYVEKQ